ncbi:MAG: arginase [Thermotogota bacterium]|nr:arginase [Thermotogota bacterium]
MPNKTKSNSYPELHGVDLADRWDESYCTYLGRSQEYAVKATHAAMYG